MRKRDSVLKALNGHSDHGRIEMKKILPKISFTLSLQMRSKLLLLSQEYTSRFVSGWRYGATDENLLRNIRYSALEQTS
ncbi:hypothetical protein ES332_D03G215600v1 [Gossypium tomentosum]|uniref:Uncharacterized protein n=1 Tax=Gossypium tomentosum TaxID=34277 RepID=A0A5D2LQX3_GOSTO|nr:hypothetical protein ES332_D03G215600v1 [Gossypium tomentosum]